MPRWTRDRVARELENFLACRDEWPSWREFERAGHKQLRTQVGRFGGPQQWAAELGVIYDPRAGARGRSWTDARVRGDLDLDRFMAGRRAWPSASQFRAAGQRALWQAVRARGGPARWAPRYGLAAPPTRRAPGPPWTADRMETALREFVAGHDRWPTKREFSEAGYAVLLRKVYETGGSHAWAARLGVRPPRRPRRVPR